MNNAPAARKRAQRDRRMSGEHYIKRNRRQRSFVSEMQIEQASGGQHYGDDPHSFLRVIAAMAQRVGGRRK